MKLSARDAVVIETIRPFFDVDYYLSNNPDLVGTGIDPIEHFAVLGWKEGRDPTADFSTLGYLSLNPEVTALGVNPFMHHIVLGRHQRLATRLNYEGEMQFDSSFNDTPGTKELAAIRDAFDDQFYLRRYPDVAASGFDPFMHFLVHGWKEGRDPTADFSTEGYLANNPDVAAAGLNPFWHFVVAGREAGRVSTIPSESRSADGMVADGDDRLAQEIAAIRDAFDDQFYLRRYPDVAASGFDPIMHFLDHGWKEGRDPTADFSTEGYLANNPDVAAAGLNPFWHFVVAGREDGRVSTISSEHMSAAGLAAYDDDDGDDDGDQEAQEIAAIRDAFDTSFYLSRNPDVAETGMDPIKHFVRQGWKEARDPNGHFSVAYYLAANPDVRDLKINPFWHYVVAGMNEGRLARHPGGHKADTLKKTLPLEEVVAAWRFRKKPRKFLDAAELHKLVLMANKSMAGANQLIISFGHDNYRAVSGGVQYCIQHEEETATGRGVLYLNLHPYQPLPRLSHMHEDPDVVVSVLAGGKAVGATRMSELIKATKALADDFGHIEVVVHHLMGHSPEQITAVVRASGSNRCWLWLHDFFTLCPSYALQRNNVSFCGAPPQTSNACRLCLYGEERINHRARIEAFFRDSSLNVIAPSQFTADYWSLRSGLSPASLTVRDHLNIAWTESNGPSIHESKKITVAFVGYPAPHKGWPVFERIVGDFGGKDSKFSFVYFGTSRITQDDVEMIPVSVTAEDPDAMIRAIGGRGVDIVLHWAACAETFSFSTHEALAGGAFVLTNPISGNVAVTVRRLRRGAVLEDEADLLTFFRDGRVEAMVAEARSRRRGRKAVLSRSDMIFGVLDLERQP